jgi:hypothetical protein
MCMILRVSPLCAYEYALRYVGFEQVSQQSQKAGALDMFSWRLQSDTSDSGASRTGNVFHVVDLRPADVDEVFAVGLQWSWLKVVYFLDSMILIVVRT